MGAGGTVVAGGVRGRAIAVRASLGSPMSSTTEERTCVSLRLTLRVPSSAVERPALRAVTPSTTRTVATTHARAELHGSLLVRTHPASQAANLRSSLSA